MGVAVMNAPRPDEAFWRRAFTVVTAVLGAVLGVAVSALGWFVDQGVKDVEKKVDNMASDVNHLRQELHDHEISGERRDTQAEDDNKRDRARLDKLEEWQRGQRK